MGRGDDHLLNTIQVLQIFQQIFSKMFFFLKDPYSVAGQIALTKKQGVSGQSVAVSHDVQIDVHEKDFRSKTLIKEAIMENDFLKNLSPSQVGI